MTEKEKLCNRYDNVYFVRETEDCVNCLHSEFDRYKVQVSFVASFVTEKKTVVKE